MPNRREFVYSSVLAAAGIASSAARTPVHAETQSQPNIVLILADDMGFSDIGCYGSEIDTPNLDRLASQGLRFSQFYNSPRCCPSRAALLTGVYSHQAHMGLMTSDHGVYPSAAYDGDLSKDCVTIAEALRPVGYTTLMSGKWHLTPFKKPDLQHEDQSNWPLQRGFDRFYGIIAGAADYYNPATLVRDNEPIREQDKDFYLTDGIADHAAKFVTEARRDRPFFLYTAFNAPHWPLQAPEKIVAKYRTRYREGWDAARRARHARQIERGVIDTRWSMTDRDPRVPAWSRASFQEWEAERMAVYAAQVEIMDAGIGRITKAITDAGQLENTLILFMTDNGGNYEEIATMPPDTPRPLYMTRTTRDGTPMVPGNVPSIMPGPASTFQSYGGPWGNVSNTPFRLYKHHAHEGGISSPLVVHWPRGIRARGAVTSQVAHEIDVMATCLAISGAPYPTASKNGGHPPPLEGQSLLPVLQGGVLAHRGMLFWEHEGNCAVRDGKWKLVSVFPNSWELYDMESDRTETNNLADIHPEQVVRLAEAYRGWAKRVGAQPWPMPQTPASDRTGALPLPDYLKVDRP